jgi:hypothetical protein
MAVDFAPDGVELLAAGMFSIYHGAVMKSGMRPLGRTLGVLLRPALRRRGFAVSEILTRWPLIVGDSLAEMVAPERLRFPIGAKPGTGGESAVLHLRVASGFGPEVQHLEPLIIERINGYYGYRAVSRLKLVQGPLPVPPRRPDRSLPPLSPAAEQRLKQMVDGVGDPGLREALAQLGRSLAGRAKGPAEAPSKG